VNEGRTRAPGRRRKQNSQRIPSRAGDWGSHSFESRNREDLLRYGKERDHRKQREKGTWRFGRRNIRPEGIGWVRLGVWVGG